MKPLPTEQLLIDGPAGAIEILIDAPASPCGIALVAHPHPLFGGTNTNKVVHTLARSLRDLGYLALRPNFRGVGQSAGKHDHGEGETDDLLAVLAWAKARWPGLASEAPVLAGFSFGAYVQTRVVRRLQEAGTPARRIILVATAHGFTVGAHQYKAEAVPPDALLIHGANDVTVPLDNARRWADPLGVPIIVIPGADHFFNGHLQALRELVCHALAPL